MMAKQSFADGFTGLCSEVCTDLTSLPIGGGFYGHNTSFGRVELEKAAGVHMGRLTGGTRPCNVPPRLEAGFG